MAASGLLWPISDIRYEALEVVSRFGAETDQRLRRIERLIVKIAQALAIPLEDE